MQVCVCTCVCVCVVCMCTMYMYMYSVLWYPPAGMAVVIVVTVLYLCLPLICGVVEQGKDSQGLWDVENPLKDTQG